MNRPITPAERTQSTGTRPMATTAIEEGLASVASTALKPIQERKSENDNANQIVSGRGAELSLGTESL